MPDHDDSSSSASEWLRATLQPFLDQFRWSFTGGDIHYNFYKWKTPLTKFGNDLDRSAFGEENAFSCIYDKLYDAEAHAIDNTSVIPVEDRLWKKHPEFMMLKRGFQAFSYLHWISRAIVGLPGALFEWAERKTENKPWLIPLRLTFYLLKQPFKWAETAVSSVFQMAGGVFALAYATGCGVSLLWERENREQVKSRAGMSFNFLLQKTGQAAARLLLTGLIGVSAYFGGPPAVAALAGTLGTVGAGCVVAGASLLGVTGIQYAALSLVRRPESESPGGGRPRSSTSVANEALYFVGDDKFEQHSRASQSQRVEERVEERVEDGPVEFSAGSGAIPGVDDAESGPPSQRESQSLLDKPTGTPTEQAPPQTQTPAANSSNQIPSANKPR